MILVLQKNTPEPAIRQLLASWLCQTSRAAA